LNEVEAVVEGLRFDEVDGESPGEVGSEEETEGGAVGVRAAIIVAKGEGEQGKEEDLVELGGMAGDAITEVNAPRREVGVPKVSSARPAKKQPMRPMAIPMQRGTTKRSPVRE
jgi:hypothetical protein